MKRLAKPLVAMITLAVPVLVVLVAAGGCGSTKNQGGFDTSGDTPGFNQNPDAGGGGVTDPFGGGNGNPGGGAFDPGDDGGLSDKCPAGSPLSCYVNMNCPGGAQTTLKGKVYDPAGKNGLRNVVVFIPNDVTTLPEIGVGTNACSSCDTPVGDYVTATFTGDDGSFTLNNVPTGKNVPLVVQIGKWRRVITVAAVADCKTTTLPTSGTGQARLPRNRMEGNIPKMGLLTGGLDDLGCFLRRMGIDASEYSAPGGAGKLDIYQGLSFPFGNGPALSSGTAGNCTNTNCPLWASKASLEKYDIVILACEGSTFDPDDAPPSDAGMGGGGLGGGLGGANVTKAGKQAMHDWLNEGGKVFATHFHYTWFKNGPPDFQAVATWKGATLGAGTCNCSIDTSFQGGKDFDAWLKAAGASSGTTIALNGVADSVGTVSMPTTNRWIFGDTMMGSSTADDVKYFSFNTPIGGLPVTSDAGAEIVGKQYCGKAVFSDLHAGGAPSGDVPSACKVNDLSPQEKALEYLFFDLAACVRDETMPPVIPPPPPK